MDAPRARQVPIFPGLLPVRRHGHGDPAGFAGLKTKITDDAKGQPVLADSVTGMSVQASYALYVSQPRLKNSPHGLCGILLAASVME